MGRRIGRWINAGRLLYAGGIPWLVAVICVALITFAIFISPYLILHGIPWVIHQFGGAQLYFLSLDVIIYINIVWAVALGSALVYRQIQWIPRVWVWHEGKYVPKKSVKVEA